MRQNSPLNDPSGDTLVLHASTVAVEGRGLLILGASGRGKSSVALQMMALGAALVADDRTILRRGTDHLFARAPDALTGRIEARGIGILNAINAGDTPLHLILDLDITETDRLPPRRTRNILGMEIPVIHNVETPYLSAMIMQYLKTGRSD